MAQLAIKGHATRGKEVIEILEMLGGKIRRNRLAGNEVFSGYYINENGYIDYKHYSLIHDATFFALKKFMERFPYKVGDKVQHKGASSCGSAFEVEKMRWVDDHVEYTVKHLWYNDCHTTVTAEDLQPYKEEKMESFEILESHCANEVKIEFDPSKFEMVKRDDGYYVVKKQPQYPKTYEECCRNVNANPYIRLIYSLSDGQKYSYDVDNLQHYENIRELLICRDAYWKIAGEQMGLGKPWGPDWGSESTTKYVISQAKNKIRLLKSHEYNHILSFPTAEMRDAFLDNFKNLIESCKEFL